MFEIANFLPVKGKSINLRAENHGDEQVPCMDWSVTADVMNDWLVNLDPALKPMFYRPVQDDDEAADRPQLEGIDLAMPVLRSTNVKFPLALNHEFVGYQLTVDRGLGGKSNITLLEVKVNKFTIDCKEGGSVVLSFRIQAQRVSEVVRGQMSSYIKGATTALALKPPSEKQTPIDGTQGHPGAKAAQAQAEQKPAPTGDEAAEAFAANEAAGKNKPATDVPAAPKKRASKKPSLKVVEA